MNQCIIFQNTNGGVSVVYPAPEYEDQLESIALKDVPAGCLWRIVNIGELPQRESRDSWLWTDSGPLGASGEGLTQT
jgi:hypothetical protein